LTKRTIPSCHRWVRSARNIHFINKGISYILIEIDDNTIFLMVLLVDDLFDSGVTLNEAVNVLKSDINVADVYVLVMTQTRGK